jgi:hypothetical protein
MNECLCTLECAKLGRGFQSLGGRLLDVRKKRRETLRIENYALELQFSISFILYVKFILSSFNISNAGKFKKLPGKSSFSQNKKNCKL